MLGVSYHKHAHFLGLLDTQLFDAALLVLQNSRFHLRL